MPKVILIEIGFFLVSLISSYLTWGPMTSREMVEYFSPPIITTVKLSEARLYERKRKAGISAEILRAFLITIFGLLVVPFYSISTNVSSVLFSPFFRWSFLLALLISLLWCIYLGPRFFAIRHCGKFKFFSKTHFTRYMRPYWVWFAYPLFVWGGIGLITFWLIVGGIAADVTSLQLHIGEINKILLVDIERFQYATIKLIEFGGFASTISQKYVLTTLLIFIYVIIEQRSSMRHTILDTSLERTKYVVWAALFLTIGFSLFVLPNQYGKMHTRIQNQLEMMTFASIYPDHLGDVLSIQKTLEDHDMRWLVLRIVTGYGNILTASLVGFSLLIWRLFFDKVPVKYILRLFIPKNIMERVNRFGEGFRIDLNIKNE